MWRYVLSDSKGLVGGIDIVKMFKIHSLFHIGSETYNLNNTKTTVFQQGSVYQTVVLITFTTGLTVGVLRTYFTLTIYRTVNGHVN